MSNKLIYNNTKFITDDDEIFIINKYCPIDKTYKVIWEPDGYIENIAEGVIKVWLEDKYIKVFNSSNDPNLVCKKLPTVDHTE